MWTKDVKKVIIIKSDCRERQTGRLGELSLGYEKHINDEKGCRFV